MNEVVTFSWGKRLLPLIVTQVFLWLTVALFTYGPWQWPLRHPNELYAFLIASHLALALGYLTSAHEKPRESRSRVDTKKLLNWSLWASLAVLPITSFARTGKLMPDFIGGLVNPGQAYADAHQFTNGEASNPGSYLRILLSPVLMALFPLAIYFWRKLSRTTKILSVMLMVSTVLLSVATGQRRDIADLMIILPFIAMASHWRGITCYSKRTITAFVVGGVVFLAGFTTYFVYSHVSRVGKDTAAYGVNPATHQYPDLDNGLLRMLPISAQPGFIGLANYLTTGYEGLALSLDRPFKPMYGAGHSMFLSRNAARLLNDPAFETRSYPVQISDKDGFRYPVLWATAYPYFASDLTFPGTVLMLFVIGRLFAKSWIDTLGGKNPFAIVMFSLLAIFIFYLPATNRMLQDGEGVVAFYVWLVLWSYYRRQPRSQQAALQMVHA